MKNNEILLLMNTIFFMAALCANHIGTLSSLAALPLCIIAEESSVSSIKQFNVPVEFKVPQIFTS